MKAVTLISFPKYAFLLLWLSYYFTKITIIMQPLFRFHCSDFLTSFSCKVPSFHVVFFSRICYTKLIAVFTGIHYKKRNIRAFRPYME